VEVEVEVEAVEAVWVAGPEAAMVLVPAAAVAATGP
jgi:hypothetical protein